jgi:hypothetical protein
MCKVSVGERGKSEGKGFKIFFRMKGYGTMGHKKLERKTERQREKN